MEIEEENVTKEELAEAVRILKADLDKSEVRALNKRLDEMETARSERYAKDDERWEKWEQENAGKDQKGEEGNRGDKGNLDPGIPPVAGGPPPIKEEEPPAEKKGTRLAWWERELYKDKG